MLTTDPNTIPKPHYPRRSAHKNAVSVPNGDAYQRATIFAPTTEQAEKAVAYYNANNHSRMDINNLMDRAIYLASTFDAEAVHLLFRRNPD